MSPEVVLEPFVACWEGLDDNVRLFLDDPAQEATVCGPVVDADHGRIETRTAMLLTAIGKVTRVRETAAKTPNETAYYINRP